MRMPMQAHFFQRSILTRKVGQTDLVFGVPSGFIRGYAHARLQVSICNGYYFVSPCRHTHGDRRTDSSLAILYK